MEGRQEANTQEKRHREKETKRQRKRQGEKAAGNERQRHSQTDRQTDRQTERKQKHCQGDRKTISVDKDRHEKSDEVRPANSDEEKQTQARGMQIIAYLKIFGRRSSSRAQLRAQEQ